MIGEPPRPDFEVLATLGQGGMGVVYRVRDPHLGRLAALKVMSEAVASPEDERRFFEEARALGRLNHPNIPPLYGVGRLPSGQPFMLMRLVEGQTLKARLAESAGSAPLRGILEALIDVGEAVAYAHSEGILHRDLKPENIMIGRFGETLVLDWGLTKAIGEDAGPTGAPPADLGGPGLTVPGSVMGTPGYMPPEQARGEALDRRADVFALGAILCEVLTGEPPISAPDAFHRLSRTIKGDIRRPSAIKRGLPRELDALAAAALEPDAARRLPSAEAFVADLRAYLAGDELAVYRYSAKERLARWQRRHGGALFAAGIILMLAAGLWVQRARYVRTERRQAAERRAREAEELLDQAYGEALTRGEPTELLSRATALSPTRSVLFHAARIGVIADDRGLARAYLGKALAAGERDPGFLIRCAEVFDELGELASAEGLLLEAEGIEGRAYRSLLQRHLLGIRRSGKAGILKSAALDRLLRRAELLGAEGGAVAVARFLDQAARGRFTKASQVPETLVVAGEDRELSAAAEVLRGYVYASLGAAEESRRCFQRAMSDEQRRATGLFIEGLSAMRSGRSSTARQVWKRVTELVPGYGPAYFQLGLLELRRGHGTAARRHFERVIALEPGSPEGRAGLILLDVYRGRIDGAEPRLMELLELRPELGEVYEALAEVARSRGEASKALALYERASASHHTPSYCLFQRGLILAGRGEHAAALAELDRAIRAGPETWEIHYRRGLILLQLDRAEEALAAFDAALARDPGQASVLCDRGAVKHRLGRKAAALADYNAALERNTELVRALINRGFLLADLGRRAAAMRDLERFLSLAPGHSKSREARRMINQLQRSR